MSTMDPWKPDPAAWFAPGKAIRNGAVPPRGIQLKLRIIFIPWKAGSPEAAEWKGKSEQWNTVKEDKFRIIYYDDSVNSDPVLALASRLADSVIYIRGHGSPGAPAIVTKVKDLDIPLPIVDACDRLIGMGLKPTFRGAVKFHFCYSGTIFDDTIFQAKVNKAQDAVRKTQDLLDDLALDRDRAGPIITQQQNRLDNMGRVSRFFQGDKAQTALDNARNDKLHAETQIQAGLEFRRNQELKVPSGQSLAKKGAEHMRQRGFNACRYYGYLGPMESEYNSVDTSSTTAGDWHKFVNLEALTNVPGELERHLRRTGNQDRAMVRSSVCRVQIL